MKKITFSILIALFSYSSMLAQASLSAKYGKGIRITSEDSTFYIKIASRVQSRYSGIYDIDQDDYSDQMLLRRVRLKFDGFMFSPKLVYKIEFALSNSDTKAGIIPQSDNTANMVLHAELKWEFARNWFLWFGQTKLPGNRERVISSRDLQFVDRSLVNARFTLDRDIGFQLHHKSLFGKAVFNQAFSISMGEGRNISSFNSGGYDYNLRFEFLPMGEFTNKGDYKGPDLEREPTPKLSIGITYDFNDGAARQRGQLGSFVEDAFGNTILNDLSAVLVDAMFKYNGLSIASEYANKWSRRDLAGFGTGSGFAIQSGYLFPNNLELSARYTTVKPDDVNISSIPEEIEYTIGLSKYIVGHVLKVQSDLSYRDRKFDTNFYEFRFQVEMGF